MKKLLFLLLTYSAFIFSASNDNDETMIQRLTDEQKQATLMNIFFNRHIPITGENDIKRFHPSIAAPGGALYEETKHLYWGLYSKINQSEAIDIKQRAGHYAQFRILKIQAEELAVAKIIDNLSIGSATATLACIKKALLSEQKMMNEQDHKDVLLGRIREAELLFRIHQVLQIPLMQQGQFYSLLSETMQKVIALKPLYKREQQRADAVIAKANAVGELIPPDVADELIEIYAETGRNGIAVLVNAIPAPCCIQ